MISLSNGGVAGFLDRFAIYKRGTHFQTSIWPYAQDKDSEKQTLEIHCHFGHQAKQRVHTAN